MSIPQYVDISVYQPENVNWLLYKQWASQWDGISRVCMRAVEYQGKIDNYFFAHRDGALNVDIQQIGYYVYIYPQYENPIAAAAYMHSVVPSPRSGDWIMIDYEENAGTSSWIYNMEVELNRLYNKPPTLYCSLAMIRARLQDPRLAQFPLTLADWTYNPHYIPQVPWPWKEIAYWQYANNATIPGIGNNIDVNLFIHGETMNLAEKSAIEATWNENNITPAPRVDTGIYVAWLNAALQENLVIGPARDNEQQITTWDGSSGVRQRFDYGFIEWVNNTPRVFGGIRV